jgi:hypothetical protein
MTYLVACLVVGLCAAAAALASLIVSRTVPMEMRRRHYEVGSQVFLQIGVMFAVLLAFVFSEVWGQYNTAAQAINGECGALHGAAMLANALPDGKGRPLNQAIATYAGTVIDKEWPLMARRQRSAEAVEDFRIAFDLAARLNPTQPGDAAIKSQVLTLLSLAHAERETRTFQVDLGLPLAMWIVLSLLALFLVSFVLFASAFTGCTVMVLVLVRMLDFPFEGALSLANTDFVKMLGEVSTMLAGG